MTRRSLFFLGVLALIAVASTSFVLWQSHRSEQDTTTGTLLLPELDAHTIARIEITGPSQTIILARQGDVWVLPQKNDYPADSGQVAKMVSTLAHLRTLEEKTADPARYPDLNLAPPTSATGAGKEIKFFDAKNALLADVVIGRSALSLGDTGGGFYIRRADQPASWLVEGTIEVPITAIEWTDHNLFGLADPGAIKSASLLAGAKPIVTVARAKADDQSFTITPTPPDTPDQGKALRLALMPVALSFDDIRRAAPNDGKILRSAKFQGFAAGVGYQLDLFPDGWARVSESGDGDAVKTFNAFHAKWLYKLPSFRAQILNAGLKDFSIKDSKK